MAFFPLLYTHNCNFSPVKNLITFITKAAIGKKKKKKPPTPAEHHWEEGLRNKQEQRPGAPGGGQGGRQTRVGSGQGALNARSQRLGVMPQEREGWQRGGTEPGEKGGEQAGHPGDWRACWRGWDTGRGARAGSGQGLTVTSW